ncbi:hypothetical protein JKF63_01495 [Porcisia hertigi]|uniref:Sphingomyelin synthase-like domain-containing protein n=1 Tax=Porcisia hertigi TaxID=2761500 RepID=A0A836HY63_9TRYP|nr:hypothetical protein JKF63_01495 [Porcisia hertigi]
MTRPAIARVEAREEKNEDLFIPWYKQPLPLTTQIMRFVPVLLLTVVFLGGALVITNGRMPNPQEVRPLPDVLLEWIPKVAFLEAGTNVIIFLLNATVVAIGFKLFLLERHLKGRPNFCVFTRIPKIGPYVDRIVFGIVDSGRRPFSLHGIFKVMVIRFLTSYAVVMVFRSFVIVATSYPATDNHCQHPQVIENPALNIILTLVTLGGGAIHCGDLMFSGHTMILSLSFMLIWDYSPFVHPWALRLWGSLLLPLSFYCILSSRSHYTDDILVSMYVMIATYKLIDHAETGAPWQMQLLIRWMPGPGTNTVTEDWLTDDVVVVVDASPENAPGVSAPVPEHESVAKATTLAQVSMSS